MAPIGLLAGAIVVCLAGLGACSPQPSDAVTVLTGAAGAFVADAAGVEHPATEGEQLFAGARIRSTTGSPVLTTGGRRTTLGPASELQLQARSVYELLLGTVVIDRRRGPGVVLTAADVQISALGRTAVRVQRGFSVRVALYTGGSATIRVGGRSRTVPPLSELIVPGVSLPAAARPLALRDDALDQIADLGLVSEDRALRRRAAGLDGPGGAAVAVALDAALPRLLPSVPSVQALETKATAGEFAAPLSERVLPLAIATTARGSRPDQAYRSIRALRAAGGSWGVLAALASAPLGAVQDAITALIDTPGGMAPDGTPLTARLVAAANAGRSQASAIPASPAGPGGRSPSGTPAPAQLLPGRSAPGPSAPGPPVPGPSVPGPPVPGPPVPGLPAPGPPAPGPPGPVPIPPAPAPSPPVPLPPVPIPPVPPIPPIGSGPNPVGRLLGVLASLAPPVLPAGLPLDRPGSR